MATNCIDSSNNAGCQTCTGCPFMLPTSCSTFDGAGISCITYGSNPTLNDILAAIGDKLCTIAAVTGGFSLSVQEEDGSPLYTLVNSLRFNQAQGFTVTQPDGVNTALVGISMGFQTAAGSTGGLIDTFLYSGNSFMFPMVNSAATALVPVQILGSNVLAVKAATTTTLPAFTYANGAAGVGATMTANANGAFPTVDGIAITAPTERFLYWTATSAIHNGVWVLTQQGSGGTPWIATRATDADTSAELDPEVVIPTQGTQKNIPFSQKTSVPVIGTDDIVYTNLNIPTPSNAWLIGGNNPSATKKFGTKTNQDISVITNNINRMYLKKDGTVGINTNAPAATLDIQDDGTNTTFRTRLSDGITTNWAIKNDGYIYRSTARAIGIDATNTVVGWQNTIPSTGAGSNVLIGSNITLGAGSGIITAVGVNISPGQVGESVFLGNQTGSAVATLPTAHVAVDAGGGGIFIGSKAGVSLATAADVIVIGTTAFAKASHQCIIGGQDNQIDHGIRTVVFGQGVEVDQDPGGQNVTLQDVHITTTGIIAGATLQNQAAPNNIYLDGSVGTGTGAGGSLIFRTAPAGGAGSAKNPLAGKITIDSKKVTFQTRANKAQGLDVASQNGITLGMDGNSFVITGNVQINGIVGTDWQLGSEINLIFTGTPTIKNLTGAGVVQFKLLNGVDFTISKNPTVMKFISISDGLGFFWMEVSRSADAA